MFTTGGTGRAHPTGCRACMASHQNTRFISELFIEDANFLRISNLTLGYNLNLLFKKFAHVGDTVICNSQKSPHLYKIHTGLDPEVWIRAQGY